MILHFRATAHLDKVKWSRVQEKYNAAWAKKDFGFGSVNYHPVNDRAEFIKNAMSEQFESLVLAFGEQRDGEILIRQYDNTITFSSPKYATSADVIIGTVAVKSALNLNQFGHLAKKAIEYFQREHQGYKVFYDDHHITGPLLTDVKGHPQFIGECIHDYDVVQVLSVENGIKEYVKCKVCSETAYRDVKMVSR